MHGSRLLINCVVFRQLFQQSINSRLSEFEFRKFDIIKFVQTATKNGSLTASRPRLNRHRSLSLAELPSQIRVQSPPVMQVPNHTICIPFWQQSRPLRFANPFAGISFPASSVLKLIFFYLVTVLCQIVIYLDYISLGQRCDII